jgi:hypothetical protein
MAPGRGYATRGCSGSWRPDRSTHRASQAIPLLDAVLTAGLGIALVLAPRVSP